MANDIEELFNDPQGHQQKHNPNFNNNNGYNKGYNNSNNYNNNRQYNNNGYNKNYNNNYNRNNNSNGYNNNYNKNYNNYNNNFNTNSVRSKYSNPKYVVNNRSSYSSGNNSNKLWYRKDFKPLHYKPEELNKASNHILLDYYCYTPNKAPVDKQVLEDLNKAFSKIIDISLDHGHNIRLSGGNTDSIFDKLSYKLDLENKDEVYTAWENMSKLKPKVLSYATEDGYRTLKYYSPSMDKLPDTLRAVLASKVHCVLGKDCKTPPLAIVVYLENKLEEIPKGDIDFKQFGNLYIYYQIANDYNIPIFNLSVENSVERFTKYLSTFKTNTTDTNTNQTQEQLPF